MIDLFYDITWVLYFIFTYLNYLFHCEYISLKFFQLNSSIYCFPLYLKDGCSSDVVKQIEVWEKPRTCDFAAEPDYEQSFYGLSLNPVNAQGTPGGQDGIDYSWNVKNIGNQNSQPFSAIAQAHAHRCVFKSAIGTAQPKRIA